MCLRTESHHVAEKAIHYLNNRLRFLPFSVKTNGRSSFSCESTSFAFLVIKEVSFNGFLFKAFSTFHDDKELIELSENEGEMIVTLYGQQEFDLWLRLRLTTSTLWFHPPSQTNRLC